MHIPSSMLNGSICPVTAAVSVAGIAAAAWYAWKSERHPTIGRFAAVTSLVFAAQMLNFPVMNGTSGHLLGGVVAAAALGTPFGVLSLAMVVTIQALMFADGGIAVLGANLLNMALIGAGVGGMLCQVLRERAKMPSAASVFLASFVAVVLAALAVSLELAGAGQIALTKVLPAMLGVHLLIGAGEGLISMALCAWLGSPEQAEAGRKSWIPVGVAALLAAIVVSPFACGWPDGLEWVAEKLQFLHESAPAFVAPLPDYTIPALGESVVSTALAGCIGVLAVGMLSFAFGAVMRQVRIRVK